MAGANHVSINSKVTMNKLQKINYKGESRYEYLRKVLFTRQNKFSSPPESALKTRRLTKHIVFYNLCLFDSEYPFVCLRSFAHQIRISDLARQILWLNIHVVTPLHWLRILVKFVLRNDRLPHVAWHVL